MITVNNLVLDFRNIKVDELLKHFHKQKCQSDRLYFSPEVGNPTLMWYPKYFHLQLYFCELCPEQKLKDKKTQREINEKD